MYLPCFAICRRSQRNMTWEQRLDRNRWAGAKCGCWKLLLEIGNCHAPPRAGVLQSAVSSWRNEEFLDNAGALAAFRRCRASEGEEPEVSPTLDSSRSWEAKPRWDHIFLTRRPLFPRAAPAPPFKAIDQIVIPGAHRRNWVGPKCSPLHCRCCSHTACVAMKQATSSQWMVRRQRRRI